VALSAARSSMKATASACAHGRWSTSQPGAVEFVSV